MPTVKQIAKIQLRRGPQQDLPGEPSIGNPTIPTTGLDVGEPVFATDTGRMFVGIDPIQGGPTKGRVTFPYENIEILTENSTERLQTVFDHHGRDIQTAYYTASLSVCDPNNSTDWRAVVVTSGSNSAAFTINSGTNPGMAQITYFLFDATTGAGVRTGRMTVATPNAVLAPNLSDDGVAVARSDLAGSAALDPNALYASTQFRAVATSTQSGPVIVLQYRNVGPGPQNLRFRIERAVS